MTSRRILTGTVVLALVLAATQGASAQWTQWGGPNQDFKVEGGSLAKEWPDEGPKQLWSHKLGEGYSAIVADNGKLYTMYRVKSKNKADRKEAVVAMNAADGEVLWEYKYDAAPAKGHVAEFGAGPRGTPLVFDGKLYTIGVSGKMHCLDVKKGKVLWAHDLWDEMGGTVLNHGYSSSPIGFKGTVIALVGGEGHGIVAFDKDSGEVVWKKHDFINSYSTPKIVKVDGKDQMICFMGKEVVGIDPSDGELLWSFAHKNQWNQNITLPIWSQDERTLVITSPGDGGTRGLKLTKNGDGYSVEQLWENKRLGVHHTTAIRVGDTIYTSSGGTGSGGGGPSFIFAVDAKTGKTIWKERGFSKANLLYADGHFIILDEDGNLALADCTPEALKIISSTPLLKKVAWTVPTLVGRTLYLRDQDKIVALDLG
jgi:prepilin-type processing-associated H-X9-DG protein